VTEHGVPHVYAANRQDAYRILGYVMARHRYVSMELARRDTTGQIAEWFSAVALSGDIRSRTEGKAVAIQRMLDSALSPAIRAESEALTEGINLYVDRLIAGEEEEPVEAELLTSFTGESLADLVHRWTIEDVAAIAVALVYQEGFDREDIGRSRALGLEDTYGVHPERGELPEVELRRAAAIEDILLDFVPPNDTVQHVGGRQKAGRRAGIAKTRAAAKGLPKGLHAAADAIVAPSIFGPLPGPGERGSNAWSVDSNIGADDSAWLAGDPHLSLSTPPLFWAMHMDTKLLDDGSDAEVGGAVKMAGLTVPGVPGVVIGHTDRTAWSLTRLYADLVDYYLETVTLTDGMPTSVTGPEGAADLVKVDETYIVAGSALDMSPAAECVIPRWETADGRMLVGIEGTPAETPADCNAPGDAINVNGRWIVPGDTDGDGAVTGISMIFTGLFPNPAFDSFRKYWGAQDIDEWMEAERSIVSVNNSKVVADVTGRAGGQGYLALPTRDYLRGDGGAWQAGGTRRSSSTPRASRASRSGSTRTRTW
jgi:penicillin amidase